MTIAVSEEPSDSAGTFPIVAVGCSAGGLEASMDLLGSLPADAGVAIILLQHLDPTRPSSLSDLLSKVSAMTVETATAGVLIQGNRVYVIPPHVTLAVAHGRLQLSPIGPEDVLRMPIDRLFRSLARDRGSNAIAVLLSGTGSDGMLGIQSVKAEGGTTFAQDDTATYVDMPRAAVATGAVDFVLPPEQLAQELVRLAGVRTKASGAGPGNEEDALAALFIQLRARTGIDFAHYKRSTLLRRVRRRVRLNHLTGLSAYVELLEARPDELDTLCEDVLIHVTNFFRDAGTFGALSVLAFPKMIENRVLDNPLRIWVPGCSSGEEVYSIAICLLEFLESSGVEIPVKIFGTDVSASAVERARLGKYSEGIASDVSLARLQRFFSKVEGGYQIRKSVRDLCVFAKQDITRDPPFSKLDLVSCRNLMIYLGRSLQDRVLSTVHFSLRESGFLMLGAAESVGNLPGFAQVTDGGKLYAKTPIAGPPTFVVGESTGQLDAPWPLPMYRALPRLPDFQGEINRLVLSGYTPPGVVVNDALEILHFRGQTDAYVGPAPGSASLHLLRMAREDLRFELRRAIDGAKSTGGKTQTGVLRPDAGRPHRAVEIDVIPFTLEPAQDRYFLVLFRELTTTVVTGQSEDGGTVSLSAEGDGKARLQEQLEATRDYLQSLIGELEARNDELRVANHETLSTNEELRSTNEELQATKEEIQATNEELITVNDEMHERSQEAARLTDDLTNVLSSAQIPILILDRTSCIRRFTPAAAKLWNLIATDVGRPITDINPRVQVPNLLQLIASVVAGHEPAERTVTAAGGHWFRLSVRPYLTFGDRIDGVVVSLFDIDALKQGEQLLAEARDYAENIVDTLRESLLVLDEERRVHSANRSFYRTFRVSPEETEHRHLEDLGSGQWNIDAVRRLLDGLRANGQFEDLRIDQVFPEIGRRIMLLNGRRIVREGRRTPWILLAIEDITQRALAEEALLQNEKGLRDMLASAAEAIVMIDLEGRIVFVNAKTCDTFGYGAEEMIGLPVERLLPEVPLATSAARNREVLGRHKDGTEIAVEVGLSAMQRSQGQLVVAFITDITFRRRTEASIREYQVKLQTMAFDAARSEQRERRRIAADLHDRIGQTLALTQIKLASARDSMSGPIRANVDECLGLIEQSVQDTRTLTFELSPPILFDLGLKAAVMWLAERLEQRYGIRIVVEGDDGLKLADDEISALLFRAVQELLTNVLKHAHTSSARVALRRQGDQMSIEVEDAGIGFDASESDARTGAPSGFGLFSVREQIARLGGTLKVASTPRQGTHVSLLVPFAENPAAVAQENAGRAE